MEAKNGYGRLLSGAELSGSGPSRMAELGSSLISERVTAGMNAARVRGKRIGRPPLAPPVVTRIEALAATTGLSIRQI